VRRRAAFALASLSGYGITMAAAGVALAVVPSQQPVAAVLVDDGTEPQLTVSGGSQDPSAASTPSLVPPLISVSAQPSPSPSASAIPNARRATAAAGQRITFIPTRIVLPSGAIAPVTPSGVLSDGSLVIPERPDEVGWWDGGARAGDPLGSLVIAGHVDSRVYGLGVLAELKRLKAGAVIELRAGGQRLRYRVYKAVQISQQSLAADDEYFRQDGAHRLVVITCGGPFDRDRHRYLDNYIVLAKPIS